MHNIAKLNLYLNSLRSFLNKNSIEENYIPHLKSVLDSTPLFSVPIFNCPFYEVSRVTINRNVLDGKLERIYKPSLLKNPPKEKVTKLGRANFIGQSIFYAAFDPLTIMDELKPNVGDMLTISKWQIKENSTLDISPIFKKTSGDNFSHNGLSLNFDVAFTNYINKNKEINEELKEQIDILLDFLAECFAKKVEKFNHFDYFLSAYFSNKILYEFEDGTVEAIVYPSVQKKLSFSNIAIKPTSFDKKYSLFEVSESLVVSAPNINHLNGYILNVTGHSKKFDFTNDLIIWDN